MRNCAVKWQPTSESSNSWSALRRRITWETTSLPRCSTSRAPRRRTTTRRRTKYTRRYSFCSVSLNQLNTTYLFAPSTTTVVLVKVLIDSNGSRRFLGRQGSIHGQSSIHGHISMRGIVKMSSSLAGKSRCMYMPFSNGWVWMQSSYRPTTLEYCADCEPLVGLQSRGGKNRRWTLDERVKS